MLNNDDAVIIAWINFAILIVSSILFTHYYIKSVSPASLEKTLGATKAWDGRCAWYRIFASILMCVGCANYVVYAWYPLPPIIDNGQHFPWTYDISLLLSLAITIPCILLMTIGVWHAGEETMTPKKEHAMYHGIYDYIRHPQALGEWPLWFAIALAVDSVFLVAWSLIYIPIWIWFCMAEEKDLLLRYGSAYEDYRQRVGFWFPKTNSVVATHRTEKSD